MYEAVLQQLGIPRNQAWIYEVLLQAGESSVGAIALKSKIHRRNVYDCLKGLIAWGLAFPIPGRRENTYMAVEPEALLGIVTDRKKLLEDAFPELDALYHASVSKEEVFVYEGVEGWKNYLRDILRVGQPAYFIGAKGGWLDERIKNFFPYFISEARKKKLRFYHLFDYETRQRVPEIFKLVGKDYRYLPKEYSSLGAVDIFGDRTNLISELKLGSQPKDIRFTVIVNSDIAAAFRTWFKFLWDKCAV